MARSLFTFDLHIHDGSNIPRVGMGAYNCGWLVGGLPRLFHVGPNAALGHVATTNERVMVLIALLYDVIVTVARSAQQFLWKHEFHET